MHTEKISHYEVKLLLQGKKRMRQDKKYLIRRSRAKARAAIIDTRGNSMPPCRTQQPFTRYLQHKPTRIVIKIED